MELTLPQKQKPHPLHHTIHDTRAPEHPPPRALLVDPRARDGPDDGSEQGREGVEGDGAPAFVRAPDVAEDAAADLGFWGGGEGWMGKEGGWGRREDGKGREVMGKERREREGERSWKRKRGEETYREWCAPA